MSATIGSAVFQYVFPTSLRSWKKVPAFHFVGRVGLHANRYTWEGLRKVRFYSPDPYQAGKLVLHPARLGCTIPRCVAQGVVLRDSADMVDPAGQVINQDHRLAA